jgi:hypothetical protein
METGDIRTVVVKKTDAGAFVKAIEYEWLRYMGFSEKEIAADEITLIFKADISDRKKLKFIGIGRPEVK